MSRAEVAVLSARGAASFTETQRRRLERVARVTWVQAERRLSERALVRALRCVTVAGLSPRGTPVLTPRLLDRLPHLQAVALPTTGYDWIDVGMLAERGVRVAYLPGFASDSAAEFTWGLVLAAVRRLVRASEQMRLERPAGRLMGFELRGRTLGVIGLGATGSRVARLGTAFGMRVIGWDRRPVAGIRRQPLARLLSASDVVSLHLPLDRRTRHLIDAAALERMRPGACLVNTARPGLVDPRAVQRALDGERLDTYAFDCGYATRASLASLIRHPRVLAVPHISWYTREAVARELEGWIDTLVALVTGRPCELV